MLSPYSPNRGRFQSVIPQGANGMIMAREAGRVDGLPKAGTGLLLTAGLALIPLVVAGHESGNEIQSPMAQVILGGLLSASFLNLVIVPALFASGGRRPGVEGLAAGSAGE